MNLTLASAANQVNRIKRAALAINVVLRLARAAAFGMLMLSVWAFVRPQQELEQLTLAALGTLLAVAHALASVRAHRVKARDIALAMELDAEASQLPPLALDEGDATVPGTWATKLRDHVRGVSRDETRRTLALATTLVLPIALSAVSLPHAVPSIRMALSEVSKAVASLTRGASLTIIQGAVGEYDGKPIELSATQPPKIELLSQNLIEITLTGGGFGRSAPVVELRRPATEGAAGTVFQSFQMMPVRDASDSEEHQQDGETPDASRYTIAVAISEAVALHIPALASERPMANISVQQLPIPRVTLKPTSTLEDPWPDDQPLSLAIEVKAENPLQLVRLLIKSGQRVSTELVANVMTEDRLELTTDYRLVLEPYVESDLAQVEIIAEAIDRAVPQPLVGHSEPLRLTTASAYGRYRAALDTLRQLKTHVDDAISKQTKKLPKEAQDLATKASQQSEKSPFFDGLDRVAIHRFESRVTEIEVEPGAEKMHELSQTLNDFLFEHEILDDRERDRDFFVAARGLSRPVEEAPEKRPLSVKTITDRVKRFLDDRHERWGKRIERLDPANVPTRWASVKAKRPFHAVMDQIQKLDQDAKTDPKAKSEQLTALSRSVVDYRAFIEELEANEDKSREQEERKRQEGLASARDVMRELQQRQGEISNELDRAGERSSGDMEGQWPSTRMKQNTNARETKRLEGQLRSLSPTAGARVQAAMKAMEDTGEFGDAGNFQLAESNSDLAGRLLRQAENAAQQSQEKRRSRGRRRRVTGDNYYGQSVVGGDVEIKREYQVDRRYREDILDEVQANSFGDEERQVLENYLRQVIR
jgi:hypothetical protein